MRTNREWREMTVAHKVASMIEWQEQWMRTWEERQIKRTYRLASN